MIGSAVSHYAGENVHKRLLQEPLYAQGNYPEALKRAFLDTDEDMRASTYRPTLIPENLS